jgi:cyclic-di-AMP phosphodiesterase PgpH
VLRPNLVVDLEQTRQHAEQAARNLQPVTFKVKEGQVIVRSGEVIDHSAFIILDQFGLTRRGINWLGLLATVAATSGVLTIFGFVQTRIRANLSQRDQILILLLALSVPLLGWTAGISYTSLPAVGLLVGSFYGSALGVTVVGLLTLLMPLGANLNIAALVAVAAGSLLGGLMAGRLRSREELALLGGGIALLEGMTYLIVLGITGGVGYGLLSAAAWQGLAGLVWSIVALGMSPYLEQLFDLVTPIRLAELANPDRPLLKRLAMEAPGTFQHTLFVASLAEAGARALGSNVELVRTGTLYHDVGKMHDPLSFIENQLGGPNKHDALNNPWKSADIIKKHVTEGLVMARRYRLPKAIQAFIPEHQGTMLVTYFYYQAQQRVKDQPDKTVDESDFRYPGPVPQSRETGITMLADACEAALRSLGTKADASPQETTPEEALMMVNKIFKARWTEGQLVDSHLSREDLEKLAGVFVQVWMQFNHRRIHYPSPAPVAASPS